MINIKLAYLLLSASLILLVLNLINGINEKNFNYFGVSSNLLLIISMGLTIYNNKKDKS